MNKLDDPVTYFNILSNLLSEDKDIAEFLKKLMLKRPSVAELAKEKFIVNGHQIKVEKDRIIWEYQIIGIETRKIYGRYIFKFITEQKNIDGPELLTAILRISFNGRDLTTEEEWESYEELCSLITI